MKRLFASVALTLCVAGAVSAQELKYEKEVTEEKTERTLKVEDSQEVNLPEDYKVESRTDEEKQVKTVQYHDRQTDRKYKKKEKHDREKSVLEEVMEDPSIKHRAEVKDEKGKAHKFEHKDKKKAADVHSHSGCGHH